MIVSGRNPDRAYVTWSFTSMCNFACSYCPEHLHDGKTPFPDYQDALYFVDKVCEKNSDVFFEILGGETTMWPKLLKFLTEVTTNHPDIVMEINTNGSRTNRWWNKFVESNLQNNIVLNFSYHAAFCDPDLFYSNLKIASEAGYAVVANYMLDPVYFNKSRDLYERTKNLDVDTNMRVLRPNFESDRLIDGYTEEMLQYIKTSNENDVKKGGIKFDPGWATDIYFDSKQVNWQKKIINGEHSFQFWKCSAGTKRFFVGLDGDISVCSELNRDKKYKLGNLYERNFKPLTDTIVCPANFCACKIDALAVKEE